MVLRTTRQLALEGVSRSELAGIGSDAKWQRVRHGVYDDERRSGQPEEHLRLLAATLPLIGPGAVLSHATAAVLHGMAVPPGSLDRVWITRGSAGGGHLGPHLHECKAAFRDADLAEVAGRSATGLARTVVDLARAFGVPYGLAAADFALRSGVTVDALSEQIGLWPRRPWMRRARCAVEMADPGAESFGESLSRWVMWQVGVPAPVLQHEVIVNGRRYRSDFAWPDFGVLGEFDGRVKYDLYVKPGQTAADVMMAEKRREQDLQSLGWYVVRWGMEELRDPERFRSLLESAFRNARRVKS